MSKPRQLHRVLSVLLCLCMLAGMLPAYALAADSKAAGSSELTKGSSIEGTDYSVTSLKNYAIAPDISEKVIITNNAAGNSQTPQAAAPRSWPATATATPRNRAGP